FGDIKQDAAQSLRQARFQGESADLAKPNGPPIGRDHSIFKLTGLFLGQAFHPKTLPQHLIIRVNMTLPKARIRNPLAPRITEQRSEERRVGKECRSRWERSD